MHTHKHTHMTHQNSNFKKEKKNALFSLSKVWFFLSSRARVNKAYIQTHRSSSSSSLCKLPPRVSERRPRLGSTRLWRIFEWDHRLCLPTFASEFVLKTSPHRSLLPLPQFVEILVVGFCCFFGGVCGRLVMGGGVGGGGWGGGWWGRGTIF